VIAVDQGIKAVIVRAIPVGASIPLVPGVLSLTHIQNTGVAFGLLAGASPLAVLAAALTLAFFLFYNRGRWFATRALAAGMALLAGGAAGNLLDRIRFGFVTDYLDLRVWPVFNVADAAIVAGAGVLVVALWREGRGGTPRR
jgi:signal peptidase II